jgi:hypothetical protein
MDSRAKVKVTKYEIPQDTGFERAPDSGISRLCQVELSSLAKARGGAGVH